jgi:serine protease AprX
MNPGASASNFPSSTIIFDMKGIFMFVLLMMHVDSMGQYSRYIIELTDKHGTQHRIDNPSTFLSAKSIAKRIRFGINIDSTDLPVSKAYTDSLLHSGKVEILNTSKWLNQVLIRTTDEAALTKINGFSFVKKKKAVGYRSAHLKETKFKESITEVSQTATGNGISVNTLLYGSSSKQIEIHAGEFLHNNGFTGKQISIAVFDAGFFKYNTLPAFDSLRFQNRIKATWDFIDNNNAVHEDDAHGMYCLSILAANIPGYFVGTAPDADYYLFRTEDVSSEWPVEEQNWVAAAERADSLGIDIISSSLGYTTFDNPDLNYSYTDMDGKKTIVTRGAEWAFKKGMIIMNSAGNSGTNSWKYINAPADGEHVLAVGAVNILKQPAPFSSYGPSFDQRIKPDIASVGWNTSLININGVAALGNGTSFSNPNVAGLVACLWQAFPEMTNLEITDAVKSSGDRFATPDTRTGYGIPNMAKAFAILEKIRFNKRAQEILKESKFKAFPNPFNDKITCLYKAESEGKLTLRLTDSKGRIIKSQVTPLTGGTIHVLEIANLENLPGGVYFIQYADQTQQGVITVVK